MHHSIPSLCSSVHDKSHLSNIETFGYFITIYLNNLWVSSHCLFCELDKSWHYKHDQLCWSVESYGMASFHVQLKFDWNKKNECWLCVMCNQHGTWFNYLTTLSLGLVYNPNWLYSIDWRGRGAGQKPPQHRHYRWHISHPHTMEWCANSCRLNNLQWIWTIVWRWSPIGRSSKAIRSVKLWILSDQIFLPRSW